MKYCKMKLMKAFTNFITKRVFKLFFLTSTLFPIFSFSQMIPLIKKNTQIEIQVPRPNGDVVPHSNSIYLKSKNYQDSIDSFYKRIQLKIKDCKYPETQTLEALKQEEKKK